MCLEENATEIGQMCQDPLLATATRWSTDMLGDTHPLPKSPMAAGHSPPPRQTKANDQMRQATRPGMEAPFPPPASSSLRSLPRNPGSVPDKANHLSDPQGTMEAERGPGWTSFSFAWQGVRSGQAGPQLQTQRWTTWGQTGSHAAPAPVSITVICKEPGCVLAGGFQKPQHSSDASSKECQECG